MKAHFRIHARQGDDAKYKSFVWERTDADFLLYRGTILTNVIEPEIVRVRRCYSKRGTATTTDLGTKPNIANVQFARKGTI